MFPKISIIVPVYNVEKYLERCLDSIVNQSLNDIEVICINDGSTDNSLNILLDYAKNDNRIIIINQNNQGLSMARNKGIDIAKGEYILFVDSDDWIDLNTCLIYYNESKEKDLDLLIDSVESYEENGDMFIREKYYMNIFLPEEFKGTIFNNKDIKDYVFSLNVVVYGKLYRNSLLKKYDIKFPQNVYFEDNVFFWEVILAAEKISVCENFSSIRRYREKSITYEKDEKFLDVIKISNLVCNVFKKYDYVDFYKEELINYKISYIQRWYELINEDFKEDYWNLMFNDFLKIKENINLHNEFLSNLNDVNKSFYLNVLDSKNSKELDLLNKYSQLNKEYLLLKAETQSKLNELKIKKEEFNSFYDEKLKNLNEKENKLKQDTLKFNQDNDSFNKIKKEMEKFFEEDSNRLLNEKSEFSTFKEESLNEISLERSELVESEKAFDDFRLGQLDEISLRRSELVESEKAFNDFRVRQLDEISQKKLELGIKEKELLKEIDIKERNVLMAMDEYEDISNKFPFKYLRKFSKKPKVSIIVPVYNVENYLEECLDSIVNQTLRNIEIICINDGSTDNSWSILKDYAHRDNRIILINQQNQGQGTARNKGLSIAKGEYIMFVDSDDWLDLDCCKILYTKSKNEDLDMLMFLLINYSEKEGVFEDNYYNLSCLSNLWEDKIFNFKDLKELIFQISISPCQKIYKKELLENIRFPEKILFEDNPFYWDCILSAKRISLIKKHFYFRRRHSNSTTSSFNQNYLDVIKCNRIVLDIFIRYNIFNEFSTDAVNFIISYIERWYNHMMKEFKEDYWDLMKNYFVEISNNNDINNYFLNYSSPHLKEFYLNVLKSRNAHEFEYFQKKWMHINGD